MRVAYLDTFAGVSGDMFLGALVHAGVPFALLEQALNALSIGATLRVEKTDRCGIHATKIHVLEKGELAEAKEHSHGEHGHHHHGDHHHEHDHHGHAHPHAHEHGPHEHAHDAPHEGRSLDAIRRLLSAAALEKPVKTLAIRAFELLGQAEAKIHNVPVESVHFHEVGAVDAIADIVLTAVGIHALKIDAWFCSPLNIGSGTVECAHGRYPVPAPATAELLLGVPTYSSGPAMELVTPTGAALLRALDCEFGPVPAMRTEKIGYGAGTRNPVGFANVLRLSIGEAAQAAANDENIVVVLEAAVDDLNPQVIGFVSERALALGALDVMCTPVFMKKNRPGTLLTILADRAHAAAMEDLILRETSTLGVRVREERRVCLQRVHRTVETLWGRVRIKAGFRDGVELKAAPEFEDCREIATARNIPLKRVQEAALQAYRDALP
jgi:uncharacterized protein (TIGR00299 family) protein